MTELYAYDGDIKARRNSPRGLLGQGLIGIYTVYAVYSAPRNLLGRGLIGIYTVYAVYGECLRRFREGFTMREIERSTTRRNSCNSPSGFRAWGSYVFIQCVCREI